MLLDFAKLGVKNLLHRQLRSWLTMIGIFIGIATVVALITLGNGLRDAVIGQFSNLGTDRLMISAKGGDFGPPGQNTAVQLTQKDVDAVARSPYVAIAAGRMLEPSQVEFNDKKRIVLVASMPDDPEARKLVIDTANADLAEGRWPKRGEDNAVTVGGYYLKPDRFDRVIHAGDTIEMNGKELNVVGVLELTGSVEDDGMFVNEQPLRQILGVPERYNLIGAKVISTDDIDLAKESIAKNLRSSRGVKERQEDFTIQTPADFLASVDSVIGGVTAVLAGIALISVVVGGIGITNTMYTAVLERTREIGIMKAVGARNGDVLILFLFESGLLGLLGGLIGVVLGLLLSSGVVALGSASLGPGVLQMSISWPLIGAALLFSFLVGALAGTLPAYEAAKLSPVEALRQ